MPIPILYVSRQLDFGGAEHQLLELSRHIDRSRFKPLVCNLTRGGGIEDKIVEEGIEVVRIEKNRRYSFKPIVVLARMIVKNKIKIVHSFGLPAHIWSTPVAYSLGVPAILYSDHKGARPPFERGWLERLNGLVSRWDDVVLAHSQENALSLHNVDSISPRKTRIIYNGVDLSSFLQKAEPGKLRKELGITEEIPLVCMIARFDPQKSYDEFILAAQLLVSSGTRCHFICVGDGPTRPVVEAKIAELGLQRNVSLLGWRPDVPELLSDCQVSVLASRREGLPIVILEAMAAGVPVVTYNVGGCAEAVLDGETGFLVPSGDFRGLAEAIHRLIVNKELAISMGEAGKKRVNKHFNASTSSKEIQQLYLELLSQKGISL